MALTTEGRNAAATLPAELLALIFASLPQPALLAAAAVCAWWRANSMKAPLFYRPWTLAYPKIEHLSFREDNGYDDLDAFVRVVADSVTGDYGLGLRVLFKLDAHVLLAELPAITHDVEGAEQGAPFANAGEAALKSELRETVLPLMRSALSRCVALNIVLDTISAPIILGGLPGPVPLLRSLKLNMDRVYPRTAPRELAAGFLSTGTALRLTEVTLLSADVFSPSAPSFSAVHNLRLSCPHHALRLGDLAAIFPNARCLTVEARFYTHPMQSESCRQFLRQLDELHVWSRDASFSGLLNSLLDDVRRVPYIEYRSAAVDRVAPLLELKGNVSLDLSEHARRHDIDETDPNDSRFSQLRVELRFDDFVRVVDADVLFPRVFGLLDCGCIRRVTELTIDDRLLRTFIKACGSRMPQLAFLRINLVTWATVPADSQLARKDGSSIFNDKVAGGLPRGDVALELPMLEKLELRATRRDSTVSSTVLRTLALAIGRRLQLTLSNGLTLSPTAHNADIVRLFSIIVCADSQFYPELDIVRRVEQLLSKAAKASESSRAAIDREWLMNNAVFDSLDEDEAPAPQPTSHSPSPLRFEL